MSDLWPLLNYPSPNFPAFHLCTLRSNEKCDTAPQTLHLWSDALHMAPQKKKYAGQFLSFIVSL